MRDYQGESDESLIIRLRDGESDITDYLMDKYKNLVRKKALSMYILGADRDDLIQEGMIGLFKALREYDSGRDASFYTFADLCISRQMYSAIKASNRKKHAPLNSYISIYSQDDSEDGEGQALENHLLVETDTNDPEKMVIDQENVQDIDDFIHNQLSGFEQEVLDLHITGMGYREIAAVLGKDEKSVDNAIFRIKNKLKKR